MRLSHCTSGRLTPTMVSNVDHLSAQFLLVGDCVRAIPQMMACLNNATEFLEILGLSLGSSLGRYLLNEASKWP